MQITVAKAELQLEITPPGDFMMKYHALAKLTYGEAGTQPSAHRPAKCMAAWCAASRCTFLNRNSLQVAQLDDAAQLSGLEISLCRCLALAGFWGLRADVTCHFVMLERSGAAAAAAYCCPVAATSVEGSGQAGSAKLTSEHNTIQQVSWVLGACFTCSLLLAVVYYCW
jgi:hypothetical protein